MAYSIYTLADPIDGLVRYIGKTKNAENRYLAHLSSVYGEGSQEKRDWIINLKKQRLKPVFTIIEDDLSREQAHEKEKQWIRLHIKQGVKLYNQASINLSPEEIIGLIKKYQNLADQAISPNMEWKAAKELLDEQTNDILSQLSGEFYIRVIPRNTQNK